MDKARLATMEQKAREIGDRVGSALPPGVGFCLHIFHFGPETPMSPNFSTWISNSNRTDMVKAMLEMIDKLAEDPKSEDEMRRAIKRWRKGKPIK